MGPALDSFFDVFIDIEATSDDTMVSVPLSGQQTFIRTYMRPD